MEKHCSCCGSYSHLMKILLRTTLRAAPGWCWCSQGVTSQLSQSGSPSQQTKSWMMWSQMGQSASKVPAIRRAGEVNAQLSNVTTQQLHRGRRLDCLHNYNAKERKIVQLVDIRRMEFQSTILTRAVVIRGQFFFRRSRSWILLPSKDCHPLHLQRR